MAVVAACLPCIGSLRAATYTETGDAGDLPTAAQVISGTAGTSLTSISGALTLTNGVSDSDMFKIVINSPSTFSASTTAFIPGANSFDTQIAIFTATGVGVVANDDAASGGEQSSIPTGSVKLSAGTYYLLISGSGRYATSAGGLIFPNYTDGTTDPTATVGPTGAGGSGAITGYTGSSNEGGAYTIALTGAQFFAVPEPSSLAVLAAGIGGLTFVLRRRRA